MFNIKNQNSMSKRNEPQVVRINENTTMKITDIKGHGVYGLETLVTHSLKFEDSKVYYDTDFSFGLSFLSVGNQKIERILYDAVLKVSDYCPKTSNDLEQLKVFRLKIMEQFDVDLDGDIIYIHNPKESSKHVTHRFEEGYSYFDIGTGFGVKILKRNKHSVVFTYYEIREDGTILQGNPKDSHEIGICGDGEVLSDGPIEDCLFNVRVEKSIIAKNVVLMNYKDIAIQV